MLHVHAEQIACKGYKIDLSWQSGVAFRGHLRGFRYPAVQSSVTKPQKSSLAEHNSFDGHVSQDPTPDDLNIGDERSPVNAIEISTLPLQSSVFYPGMYL